MNDLKTMMMEAKVMPTYPAMVDDIILLTDEHIKRLAMAHPEKAQDFLENAYIIINGPHFNEETAKKAVEGMINMDGSSGEHWTLEQTSMAATQSGVVFNKFNKFDFYYVLNMLYSDYYGLFGDDSSTYIKLALAWLEDVDVPEGKAWRYYKNVVKV